MEEIKYKPIAGYECYLVASNGTVINARTGNVLTGNIGNTGYRKVLLSQNGYVRTANVHRLVATAFCHREDGCDEVNHIDGNKRNNAASNLEWVSREGNLRHAHETGLMPNDATPKEVIATNIETGEEINFPSIYKAARFFGISQGNICMCCKGQRPYANGFYWRYANEDEINFTGGKDDE